MRTPKLIVIDGPEGAGKSTIISKLKEMLPSDEFCFTRDPGGNHECDAIRKLCVEDTYDYDPNTLLLLYLASRTQLNKDIIVPAFQEGKHVITDRYSSSTYAYQGYAYDRTDYINTVENKLRGIIPIDYFIHLDVDPEIGLKRAFQKAKAIGSNELRFENKGVEFFQKVRDGFEHYVNNYLDIPNGNYLRINTNVDHSEHKSTVQIIDFIKFHGLIKGYEKP